MSILLILLISLSLLVCYLFLINESKTIETKVEQNGLACETVKQNGLGCDPKFVFIYIWIGDNMPDKYKKNYLKSSIPTYCQEVLTIKDIKRTIIYQYQSAMSLNRICFELLGFINMEVFIVISITMLTIVALYKNIKIKKE